MKGKNSEKSCAMPFLEQLPDDVCPVCHMMPCIKKLKHVVRNRLGQMGMCF